MDILGELETLEPSSATFLVHLTNSSVIRGARVGKGCKGGKGVQGWVGMGCHNKNTVTSAPDLPCFLGETNNAR